MEYATLEWVDWFNHRRLLAPIGNVPPAEYEQMYYDEINRSCKEACLNKQVSGIPGAVHSLRLGSTFANQNETQAWLILSQ